MAQGTSRVYVSKALPASKTAKPQGACTPVSAQSTDPDTECQAAAKAQAGACEPVMYKLIPVCSLMDVCACIVKHKLPWICDAELQGSSPAVLHYADEICPAGMIGFCHLVLAQYAMDATVITMLLCKGGERQRCR